MKNKTILIILIIIFIMIGSIILKNLNKNEEVNSLQRILNKGTFILGLDDSFPPMGFRNENNEIVGFDIDVAKEVSKRLGVELILQPISWTAKEQELNSYNIDCIWNGMSVNEEREKAMCLSLPYLENNMSFVVKNDSNINKLEDLRGKKIGVQSGSTAEELLTNSKIYKDIEELVSYTENITAFMDMEINQVDCVFLDSIVANYYITINNKEYMVLEEGLQKEEQAKREKYNPDDIFKKANKSEQINVKTLESTANTALIEYKESFFTRFKNFIFKILHINK